MRRFIAIFVLLQVVSGILAPIALASTAMTAACCRRNGKHHCMSGMSMVPGIFDDSTPTVRSSREACPHCAPVIVSKFQGLHATRFVLLSPGSVAGVPPSALESGYHVAVREWSTRGPPQSLL
jgi:hypothetical protein